MLGGLAAGSLLQWGILQHFHIPGPLGPGCDQAV